MNKAVKLRHELKHSISNGEDVLLSSRLRNLFPHDENADAHGVYRVRSLYFDTPQDMALRQKLDGVNRREKFRIRYYGDDLSFIRLEKKYKINGLCGKRSTKLSAGQVKQILCGDIAFLLKGDALMQELYSKMKGQLLAPKTIVTYEREAFLFAPGNVRITLDRDIRTGLSSLDFLNPQLHQVPVSDGLTVLEVKYDEFLPDIVKMAVQVPNTQASAYSKYAVCRKYD
ncbi:MAG: polyphosphate polymerase domain-containing protein [Oscillospiraceae bacterium]|nr:polyphosphate polymerase domain-containing protein [Oscillospiraceae bacterium]MBQ7130156.1 polyphosphate polymerase domain-containing protein [Oscillospiraceae bacterium]